jgi:peroxiredoxin
VAPDDGRLAPGPAAWALALLIVGSLLAGCLSSPSTQLSARRGDLAEIELVVAGEDGLALPANATNASQVCPAPLAEVGAEGCPAARAPYVLLDESPAHLPDGFENASGLPESLVDVLEGMREGEHRYREDVQAWGAHRPGLVREHDRRQAVPRAVEDPEAYDHDWNTTQREDGDWFIEPSEDDEGAKLAVSDWCNERFCLFRSELVDWNRTHLVVEHGAEEGDRIHVRSLDTSLAVVDAGPDAFTVDGNDPRAGERFDVYAHLVDLRGPSEGEQRAPSFELTTLEGEPIALQDLLGKPVVIEFFATWCPSCRENAKHLVQVHEEFGDRVNIVSIDVDPWESPESLRSFVEENDVRWPVAVDEQGDVSNDYGVGTLSTEVVVDARGVIRHVETGVADHERVVSLLASLSSEDAADGDDRS